eukprot:GHVU01058178.1.p1 GENE.GHVU01058178.1~~GHVU01058178.1.p1  ORF type:complete len:193 (-),score=8.99 GHVU01058178.1:160-738(-)
MYRDLGFQFVAFVSGDGFGKLVRQRKKIVTSDDRLKKLGLFWIDEVTEGGDIVETKTTQGETIRTPAFWQLPLHLQRLFTAGEYKLEQQRELQVAFSADIQGESKFLSGGVAVVSCIFESFDPNNKGKRTGYCLRIPSGPESPPYIAVIRKTFSGPKPPTSWISITRHASKHVATVRGLESEALLTLGLVFF